MSPARVALIRSQFDWLVVVALALPLASQQPAAWSDLAPPGGTDPAKLWVWPTFGKVAMYRDGEYLRVYSAVLGKWFAHPLSFGTSPIMERDFVLVPESDRWTAFSAYRGVFETLFIDHASSAMAADETMAIVRLGTSVNVFSAFTGRWHALSVPTGWRQSFTERVLVFSPPIGAAGAPVFFDALTGQAHALTVPATDFIATTRVRGSTGLALVRRPDNTHYAAKWSSHRGAWQFEDVILQPQSSLFDPQVPGTGAVVGDMACGRDVAYSGLTNTLTPVGMTARLESQGLVTVACLANGDFACIGITGNHWVPVPSGAVAAYLTEPTAVWLFADGAETHAFSGITNTLSATNIDAGSPPHFEVRGSVGVAIDRTTHQTALFSALTGQWYTLPAGVLPVDPASLGSFASEDAALLPTTTGYVAFSARTGAFVPLTGSNLVRDAVRNQVADAGRIWIFDGRTDRWVTADKSAGATLSGLYQSGFVYVDGLRATGFGKRAGHFSTMVLPEPALQVESFDGGGIVRTANHVFAYSGAPEHWSPQGFPSDYSGCAPATTWRHQLRLEPGDLAFVGVGQRLTAPSNLAGIGELWIDPDNLVLLQSVMLAPGEARVDMTVAVPDLPVLRNTRWTVQALTFPPTGQQYLTTPTELFVF